MKRAPWSLSDALTFAAMLVCGAAGVALSGALGVAVAVGLWRVVMVGA